MENVKATSRHDEMKTILEVSSRFVCGGSYLSTGSVVPVFNKTEWPGNMSSRKKAMCMSHLSHLGNTLQHEEFLPERSACLETVDNFSTGSSTLSGGKLSAILNPLGFCLWQVQNLDYVRVQRDSRFKLSLSFH